MIFAGSSESVATEIHRIQNSPYFVQCSVNKSLSIRLCAPLICNQINTNCYVFQPQKQDREAHSQMYSIRNSMTFFCFLFFLSFFILSFFSSLFMLEANIFLFLFHSYCLCCTPILSPVPPP